MSQTEIVVPVGMPLVVSDPCYIDSSRCDTREEAWDFIGGGGLGVVLEDAHGRWQAESVTYNDPEWGERVAKLWLSRGIRELGPMERVGTCGVDSGRMWAGSGEQLPLDFEKYLAKMEEEEFPLASEFARGFTTGTGYGDGAYSCWVRRDAQNQRPALVEVMFIDIERVLEAA